MLCLKVPSGVSSRCWLRTGSNVQVHLPIVYCCPRQAEYETIDVFQEKETELANITAERSRLVQEELARMQERERKHVEDNNKLKGQLKQLTKDFQYNLQLLKDRDTELELLENQITAHQETAAMRAKVCHSTQL
jgi:SMC interacting uncharacterized protein involved in chromosome segregation